MKIWDYTQQSEEWFRVRAARVTASSFSRIITPTGKRSSQWEDYAIELCAESLRPDEIKWEGNHHTDRGNELEPEARKLFEKTMNLEARQVGFVTPNDSAECPAGCSPDSLVYQPGDQDPIAGLEIKCPLAKHHSKALIHGEMPSEHKPQVHGSMAITGLDHWYFMSYCSGIQPLILRIDREEYTEKLTDELAEFIDYYRVQRRKIMPILEGRAA